MRRTSKTVAVALLAIFVASILCVALVYFLELKQNWDYCRTLELAHASLSLGMTKKDVDNILQLPPDSVSFHQKKDEGVVVLSWQGTNHQGKFRSFFGPTFVKGHYDLFVTFDAEGIVRDIYGGVN